MSCINREEAIRLIMEYQGGAMDKPTARKVLENMDGVEICEDTISRKAAVDVAKQHWYKPDIAKALEDLPSAQPDADLVAVIRCKDCQWGKEVCGNIECFTDTNVPPEYHGYEWFCPNGERRTDGKIRNSSKG